MVKTRIISSIVLVAIVLPLILIGKIPFLLLCTILGLMSIYELKRTFNKKYPFIVNFLVYFYIIILIVNQYFYNYLYISSSILVSMFITLFIPVLLYSTDDKYNVNDALKMITCILLIGIGYSLFPFVRNDNLFKISYLFILSTTTDVAAYFTGKLIGHNKLAPSISPHKTIEGSLGGIIIGTIISSIFYYYLVGNNSIIYVITITIFLTIAGEYGDLLFSAIKRKYKIKDFSNLIPGHGGVLDRFDNLLIVVITYALIFIAF